jgi:DinB superfamily
VQCHDEVEMKIGWPAKHEAESYYFRYIDQVEGDDPLSVLRQQYEEGFARLSGVSESDSARRYAVGKWSMRAVVSHISDAERLFAFRAFWFARGFAEPLPSFDQDVAALNAEPDRVPWSAHLEELRRVRLSTIALFENLPPAAWDRTGSASGYAFSVRAVAFVIAGHSAHHLSSLVQHYGVGVLE